MEMQFPDNFKHTQLTEGRFRDLWQLKSLNRHCAIVRSVEEGFDAVRYVERTRARALQITRPNLLRGLAFGAIIEMDTVPTGLSALVDAVDTRQRSRMVWQWSLVLVLSQRVAIGVHTWMKVYLSSVYETILEAHRMSDWQVAGFNKDALMKFLMTVTGGSKRLDL